jgi:hypothetical protein
MIDFSIIQKAGISVGELARLVKYRDQNQEVRSVTRAIVYRWIRGSVTPSEKTRYGLGRILELVTKAVNAGELPLPLTTSRAERKLLIVEALKRVQTNQPS